MPNADRPWMRLWHRRLRASATWSRMPPAGRGMYMDLLMEAFDRGGGLPDDEDELKLMAAASDEEWQEHWPTIKRKFVSNGDGELHNSLVDEEVAFVEEHKKTRSRVGKIGARARWKNAKGMAKAQEASCLTCEEKEKEKEKESTEIPPTSPPRGDNPSPTKPPRKKTKKELISELHRKDKPYLPGFLNFWEVYPTTEGKRAAFKAYCTYPMIMCLNSHPDYSIEEIDKRVGERLREIALEQIEDSRSPLGREDRKYIPQASRWINAGSFE